tara:strand:+ start:1173 stop:1838 length:666 start_codon:yes stop_codon:yes gene_type:complete
MKNVVYRIIYNDIHEYDTGFANFTWDIWCKKNDCILVTRNAPTYSEGLKTVFSYLQSNSIEYNKIFIINGTAAIKWDCPNIFDIVDDRLVGWRDMGDLKSIYNRVKKQDLTKYINCGSIIINSAHKDIISNLPDTQSILEFESELNNALSNINVNLDIPKEFNLNYMARYDWISHNWQDGNDKTPFFIKYAYIWRMDTMNKNEYNSFVGQMNQALKGQYII